MAVGRVQSATGNGATVTLNGVVANNGIIYQDSYFRNPTTGATQTTPTDTNGTFVASSNDAPLVAASLDIGCCEFHEQAAASGTHTVTPQANTLHHTTISEISSAAASGLFDVAKSAQDATASHLSQPTGTTSATAQADEISFITVALLQATGGNPVGFTDPVATYTTLQIASDTSNDIGIMHSFKVLNATGTQTATFNWTTVDATVCASMGCIATFKGAVVADTSTPFLNMLF